MLVFCWIILEFEYVSGVSSGKRFCHSKLKWCRQSKQCQVYFSSKSGKKIFPLPRRGTEQIRTRNYFKKIQIWRKRADPLNPLCCKGLRGFYTFSEKRFLGPKMLKIKKWHQAWNACGTRLSRIGWKLLSGNFGPPRKNPDNRQKNPDNRRTSQENIHSRFLNKKR